MNEVIKKMNTDELWGLLSDISEVLEMRNYKQTTDNAVFMYWYHAYKCVEREIDTRLERDFWRADI